MKKLLIVGNPNVGKSALFTALTKQYATVSNYPGTTVEVLRGRANIAGDDYEVVDTPGMYSFFAVSEEERVARRIVFSERADAVVHVVDSKNLERMLPLTFQLLEAGLPVVLALNMADEAAIAGIITDIPALGGRLGIPVFSAVFSQGKGIPELNEAVRSIKPDGAGALRLDYSAGLEGQIAQLASRVPPDTAPAMSRRAVSLLALANDDEMLAEIAKSGGKDFQRPATGGHEPVEYRIAVRHKLEAQRIVSATVSFSETKPGLAERLSRLMINPLTGFPILFAVLYLGLYKFVGGFGAGTIVDFMDSHLFEAHINPFLSRVTEAAIPWQSVRDLFTGEYGMLTLGIRYAVAIILPVVTLFFLLFAVIEDTGYLPRLAMLIDNIFKKIGLSGRAVIPMVLGLGCATMATVVTRTLPTRKERVLATLLLALAVPCSAQLGVVLSLIAGKGMVVAVWSVVVLAVFLSVGFLASRLLPGEPASFYMELPPLRLPMLSNVVTKTYVRVKWYLKEILPLFLLASVLMWFAQITGAFKFLVAALARPVAMVGLPPECAQVFLYGFFRRDYGAAGLYDLNKQHLLTNAQIAVACVALTLFLPCIAQFLVNLKEHGWKAGLSISAVTLLLSFAVAFALNAVLTTMGITL